MKWVKLVISLAAPLLAGALGSLFTAPAISGWYAELAKPALNPPSWVFGPVWTVLYVLMGIALFLVWQQGWGSSGVKLALAVFAFQLILNASWSIIFFNLQSPGWALVNLIVLWLALVWTILLFWKLSRSATYLLLPYLIWVSFAGYLNYAIWILN